MICSKCSVDKMITGSHYEIDGDQSPDTLTKLYSVMVLECINPSCEDFHIQNNHRVEINIGGGDING